MEYIDFARVKSNYFQHSKMTSNFRAMRFCTVNMPQGNTNFDNAAKLKWILNKK